MRLLPAAGGPKWFLNNFLGPDNAALRRQISMLMQGPSAWIAPRTVFDDLKHTFGTRDPLTPPHTTNQHQSPPGVDRIAWPANRDTHRTNRLSPALILPEIG